MKDDKISKALFKQINSHAVQAYQIYDESIEYFRKEFTRITGLDNWNEVDGDWFVDSLECGCGHPRMIDYDQFYDECEKYIGEKPHI